MLQSSLSALAIFLGSFLLFAVQPMMGRMLLPSFGGSAAVWTVCLAAFQILLLAGYGYAHGLARRPFDCQRRLHGCLLALAIVWMCGLLLLRRWLLPHVGTSSVPPLEVLACVVVGIGLPYVLLASGSSLLQAWLAQGGPDRRVYGLYAISNLGSLLGLFSYPLAAEPFVSLTWQWGGWTIGLGVYVLLVMNTKCGVGNAERGVGNAECGVGSGECGMRSAECGMQIPRGVFRSNKDFPYLGAARPRADEPVI